MEMKSSSLNCAWMRADGIWCILGLGRIQVKGEIVRIMTLIRHEGNQLMSDLTVSFSGSVLSPDWIQVSFILIEGVLRLDSSFFYSD